MVRSFSDRVLGGVCGGIAAGIHINAWLVRAIFVAGTIVTLGAGAILYGALWLALPQGSLVVRRGGIGSTFVGLLLIALIVGGWIADRAGVLPSPTGQSIYFPVTVALFGLIIIVRQVRA